jgi:hypothetical protein
MRINRHYLSARKREGLSILYQSKPLFKFGYGILFILVSFAHLAAQTTTPTTPSDAGPITGIPAIPASAQGGNTSQTQTQDNTQNPNNSPEDNTQNQNNAQTPDNSQSSISTEKTFNPQNPSVPLLPQQGSNNYGPLATAPSSNNQSSQVTTPSLYSTGTYDLSQIANNAALSQAFGGQSSSGFLSEPGMGYSYGPIDRIRLGPFDLKTSLSLSVISDDNILAGQGGARESDTSLNLTPAVLLQYGTHEGQKGYASLVYAPTLTRYFQHSDQDSDNQNVAFSAQYPFQRLSLDCSETYSQVTGINQDSNSRTTQNSSVTTFGGSYEIDDKLSFSNHVQEVSTKYTNGAGQNDEISSDNSALSYHPTDKITLGPTLNVGVERPKDSAKDTFEQALLGVSYQPTEKITVFGQGGVEFRQYDMGGGDSTNPIFSAGIGYTPFESTQLSVSAYESESPSSANGEESVTNTGFGFSATQRILQRFYLGFDFSYSHADYKSNGSGATSFSGTTTPGEVFIGPGGSQDNYVYRPSLSFSPTEWTSVALYYQYRDNETSLQGQGYHDNQFGLSLSAQF